MFKWLIKLFRCNKTKRYCILINEEVDCEPSRRCQECVSLLDVARDIYFKNHKACTKCKQVKDIKLFSKDNRRSDGLRSWCKGCDAVSRMQRKERKKREFEKDRSIKYKVDRYGSVIMDKSVSRKGYKGTV